MPSMSPSVGRGPRKLSSSLSRRGLDLSPPRGVSDPGPSPSPPKGVPGSGLSPEPPRGVPELDEVVG
eukprot:5641821-Heterocapsa_arctica.AAC.1